MRRSFNDSFPPRKPKPRPAGHIPPRLTQLTAEKLSGKKRRRRMKAAAWRLSCLVSVGAAEIVKTLRTDPSKAMLIANRSADRRSEAMRLARKISRLTKAMPPVRPA